MTNGSEQSQENAASRASSLLESLPAVFQQDRVAGAPSFLGRFLLGFEQLLLSSEDASKPGLEQTIARLYRYFDPGAGLPEGERAPAEFLHWLARWVAITLREDWDEVRQRELLSEAVPLYRMRGTKQGIASFLEIYTRLGVSIDEMRTAFQIGVHSQVGVDTLLDGGEPFFFHVRVLLPTPDPAQLKAQQAVAQAIVDLQKPAHTHYRLTVVTPTFQIGVYSHIGVDTLVG
jgi:phage tail-like protein